MNRAKNIIKSVLMIVLFYGINFYAWDWLVSKRWLSPAFASSAVYIVLFFIAILLFGKDLKRQWKAFKKEINWKFFLKIILWAGLGVLLSIVFVYLGGLIFPDGGGTQNQGNLDQMSQAIPPLLSLILMAVFAPIIEELTFRHAFLSSVPEKNKVLLVVLSILSVIAFDKIHIADPFTMPSQAIQSFYYLGLTLALTSFYFYGKRNIWYSICLHSFLNTAGFILMSLGRI